MKSINRLFKYLEFKGIKHTRFEKEIGFSNGYLKTQLKRNADFGETILVKVINYCPDLNIKWLLLGDGEMLLEEHLEDHAMSEILKRYEAVVRENEHLKSEINQIKRHSEQDTPDVVDSTSRSSEMIVRS